MKVQNILEFLALAGLSACSQKEKPNLVFVFADQLRYDALGCNGNEKAITPRIDAFARESVDLCNATTVSPVSAAYRSSLFTGKYISSTGFIINEINMNPNHRFFAQVCNDNGYNCGYVGKVHLNDQYERPYQKGPERMGFDDYWATYTFNHNSYRGYYYTDHGNVENVRVDLTDQYSPDVFTKLACDYMERASKKKKPFAMFLSWNPTHDPWEEFNCDPECYAKFKDMTFDFPVNFKEEVDQYMDRYPGGYVTRKGWNPDYLKEGYQRNQRAYYAMTNSIDNEFGKILDKIDELGIKDNTIVVFTSDHGEQFMSQGRIFKLTFYNESAHIPMFIRYPKGGVTGRRSDVCINTPDLMPTLLSLMGMKKDIPAEVEGMDLSGVLKGEEGAAEPEYAFLQGMGHTHLWQDGYEWRCIRSKDYCYAKYLRDGSEHLFDQRNDPYQMNDLVADPAYATVLDEYRAKLDKQLTDLHDEFKPCTWYRDNWMYKRFSIKAAAHGEFGPLPPLEPRRQ